MGIPELLGEASSKSQPSKSQRVKQAAPTSKSQAVMHRPDAAAAWTAMVEQRREALERQFNDQTRNGRLDNDDRSGGGSAGLDRLFAPHQSGPSSSSSSAGVSSDTERKQAAAKAKALEERRRMAAAGEALLSQRRVLPVDGAEALVEAVELFNGDVYRGAWRFGRRHGRGVYSFASGSRYEGEWKDGQMVGWGVYITEDGKRKNLRH